MAKQKWLVKVVIGLVIILGGWVFYISSKQIERNHRIQEEISTLETEADQIRRENETLSEKISYFSSDDFREQEAKKRLDLKKADETVVVIKSHLEDEGADVVDRDRRSSAEGIDENLSNYKKWWRVFF